MSELPDNSVHAVCTSPPYWGLRKYSGEQDLIWGDNHCQHEWVITPPRRSRKASDIVNLNSKEATVGGNLGLDLPSTNTCSLCGAWRGAYGLEPTPEMYVQHSVEILREIRRVLRPDGVVFWNIGDSYAGGGNYRGTDESTLSEKQRSNCGAHGMDAIGRESTPPTCRYLRDIGLKPLDLCLIPERLAIALQIDGWWVRSIIIWHKANPMPESVNGWRWERHRIKVKKGRVSRYGAGPVDTEVGKRTDGAEWQNCLGCPKCSPNGGLVLRKGSWRPTDSYEQILMLTKTSSYYCDAEAVRQSIAESTIGRGKVDFGGAKGREYQPTADDSNYRAGSEQWGRTYEYGGGGRNLRNVWSFPTKPYSESHFAVFPEKLPELCIKAATPEVGVCAKCGAPWARVIEKSGGSIGKGSWVNHELDAQQGKSRSTGTPHGEAAFADYNVKTLNWRPTCSCNCPDKVPATVLDPFAGAGTTLLVAIKLGRSAVGFEISSGYCDMINKRIDKIQIRYS